MTEKKCSHAITRNLRKVITYIPRDEQASASWDWARDCSLCGETIMGAMLD